MPLTLVPCWGISGRMRLIDYLKAESLTVADFAEKLGEAENTIRKIVYGQRQPSLPLAIKISDATQGRTTPSEMLKDAA